MARTFLRTLLLILVVFLSLSAIPGGLMLLFGVYAPPVEQLAGSVFSSFLVPGLALLLVVGGSAVLATTLFLRRSRFAPIAAAFAGVMVMSFEFIEILVIGSPPGPAFVMQVIYFVVGLTLVGASLSLLWIDLIPSKSS